MTVYANLVIRILFIIADAALLFEQCFSLANTFHYKNNSGGGCLSTFRRSCLVLYIKLLGLVGCLGLDGFVEPAKYAAHGSIE